MRNTPHANELCRLVNGAVTRGAISVAAYTKQKTKQSTSSRPSSRGYIVTTTAVVIVRLLVLRDLLVVHFCLSYFYVASVRT